MSILAVVLGISCASSSGHEFEVHGTMKAVPNGYPSSSCSMQVYVRDGQWAVFQVWEDPTNRIVTEISDDGDHVYKLTRFETNSRPFLPEDWSNARANGWAGELHPKHYPFGILDTEAISLFYAYASSAYLDQHTNQMINLIPFQPGDESRSPAGVFAFITRSSPPLGLPAQIVFRNEFQYDTNAILASSGFTNITNIQVPLKVSLVRYLPQSTNILETFEFRATQVAGSCSLKSFTPTLPGQAMITDYRTNPRAVARMTNGWPVARAD